MENKQSQPSKQPKKQTIRTVLIVVVSAVAVYGIWMALASEDSNKNASTNNINRVNINSTVNENANAANTNANVEVNLNTNTVLDENININDNLNTNSTVDVALADQNTNLTANTNTNGNDNIDTSDWETFTNMELGFSFKYPSSFGSVASGEISDGETGKKFGGSFTMGAIELTFGGASSDYYYPNEEADFLHTCGYTKIDSGYLMLLSKSDWPDAPPDQTKPVILLNEIQAINTEGILVKADFADGEDTGAIFNLNHDVITGMAFRNRNFNTLPLDQFKALLSTFRMIEIEEPILEEPEEEEPFVLEDIDTSEWNLYENDLRKFTIKYPSDWEAVEYQDYTVGFRPECCTFYEFDPEIPYDNAFPAHIGYSTDFKSLQTVLANVPEGFYSSYELGNVTGYGNYEDYDDIEQVYAPVPGNRTVFIQGQYYVHTNDENTLTKNDFRNIYLTMLGTFEITGGL
ncbi:MAG: hypothetical protein COY66_06225 [Candidatus Kerfeldbacteria bacterium CG_4_10_14_0_8_um_filter_42_10]|uniref:Uncharacterized protein n=1 Tax=Candidatus Kerfeldbacteria bacterium CG_4_10_14_0_8_um_filter_42_10 TaxID=2014248 RepID=A0A2M7RG45_9BACT|nr:MAG: hypothetical protein COY66_06225 [Candidatus Kerfeldbacteria bacterium CG_4_10_14_0_8_um_filter_42_10]